MKVYFETMRGTIIPCSRIYSITADKESPNENHGIRTYTVRLDEPNGRTVPISSYEVDEITRESQHVIPAQPGTYSLGSVMPDFEELNAVWQTPVIGWSLDVDGQVRPITPEGVEGGIRPVLMPNGMVIIAGDESWRTLDGWFADALANAKAKAGREEPSDG